MLGELLVVNGHFLSLYSVDRTDSWFCFLIKDDVFVSEVSSAHAETRIQTPISLPEESSGEWVMGYVMHQTINNPSLGFSCSGAMIAISTLPICSWKVVFSQRPESPIL
jgi:hypothetical protein